MRFPKTILLYCVDAAHASVLTTVLKTKGFRVVRSVGPGEPQPDLALVIDDQDRTAESWAHRHSNFFPSMPMLVKGSSICSRYPDSIQNIAETSSVADMIERMRAMIRQAVVQRHGDALRLHAKARKVSAA